MENLLLALSINMSLLYVTHCKSTTIKL